MIEMRIMAATCTFGIKFPLPVSRERKDDNWKSALTLEEIDRLLAAMRKRILDSAATMDATALHIRDTELRSMGLDFGELRFGN